MRLGTSGPVGAPAVGNIVVLGLRGAGRLPTRLARTQHRVSFTFAAGVLFALTMFGLVFLRSDWGIYLVIASMLLSPSSAPAAPGNALRGEHHAAHRGLRPHRHRALLAGQDRGEQGARADAPRRR